jgi:hypothetical protein
LVGTGIFKPSERTTDYGFPSAEFAGQKETKSVL